MLKINKFTSSRKRMSVLVQLPNGEYRVYCKGADSIILKRLSSKSDEFLIERTKDYLCKDYVPFAPVTKRFPMVRRKSFCKDMLKPSWPKSRNKKCSIK